MGKKEIAKIHEDSIKTGNLNLNSKKLTIADIEYAMSIISKDKSIYTLSLSNNNIDNEGVLAISNNIVNTSIKNLNLANNIITENGISGIIELLNKQIIVQLNLSKNNITDAKVKTILDSVKNINSIEKLNLSQNHIGNKGLDCIVYKLGRNETLEELDLHENNLTSKSGKYLAKLIKNCTSLEKIDLWKNKLGHEGLQDMGPALANSKSLKILDLDENNIGDHGIKILSEFLIQNSSIEEISFLNNKITDVGAKILLNVLSKNINIKKINIQNNDVSYELISQITEKINHNQQIVDKQFLDLERQEKEQEENNIIEKAINSNLKLNRELKREQEKNLALLKEKEEMAKKVVSEKKKEDIERELSLKMAESNIKLVQKLNQTKKEAQESKEKERTAQERLKNLELELEKLKELQSKENIEQVEEIVNNEDNTRFEKLAQENMQKIRDKVKIAKENECKLLNPQSKVAADARIQESLPEYEDVVDLDDDVIEKENKLEHNNLSNELNQKFAQAFDNIQQDKSKSAIIVMGNAGVGKSSIMSHFAKHDLVAKKDNSTDEYYIDKGQEYNSLKINNGAVSTNNDYEYFSIKPVQKNVPTLHNNSVATIYEYSLLDNRDEFSFISDALFMTKILQKYKDVKFVLVTTELEIQTNAGFIFKDTLEKFTSMFTNIDQIKDNIFLIVNKASPSKTPIHIGNILKNIITKNSNLDEEIKELIEILSKAPATLPMPKKEGDVKSIDILTALASVEYINHEKIDLDVDVQKAETIIPNIIQEISNNISNLISVVTDACLQGENIINFDISDENSNVFMQNKNWIESLLPKNKQYYPVSDLRWHESNEYLLYERLLKDIDNVLSSNEDNNQSTEYLDITMKLLETLGEYTVAKNDSDKTVAQEMVKDYAYVLHQQHYYISQLSEMFNIDIKRQMDKFIRLLDDCAKKVHKLHIDNIENIEVKESFADYLYYKDLVEVLENNVKIPECAQKLAYAYYNMGTLSKLGDRLKYYSKSLEYKADPKVANAIGNTFFTQKSYAKAVEIFKITKNQEKISEAMEQFIKEEPENYLAYKLAAEEAIAKGQFDAAKSHYETAIKFVQDTEIKAKLQEAANKCIDSDYQNQIQADAENGVEDQLNLDGLNIEEITTLIGDVN